jgi:predicted PurR-regulated permease PerM
MPIPPKKVSPAESLATISNVLLSAFIIATLFFGRELLVPLALAALLTFMLAPLVTRLERRLGRVASVLLVVITMCAATGGAGWVLTRQAVDLANQLPNYKENIRTKLKSIQVPDEGPFSKFSRTLEELKKDLPGSGDPKSPLKVDPTSAQEKEPMPVEVVSGRDERLEFVQVILAPVLGPLGTASLVLLLLIFMLLQREDLRNRLIRLVGQGRISATTRAMDDAGSRVAKYLQMQLVVNVTYGIPVAIGLFFIGVPNAILWGALATVLRFVPYVGPWIAAVFPILLSLAVSPDWMAPLLTISLFVVLELISNNVMEPWLYGSSTGVTPIALIVAALVWTWLWGPVGLVLATPLTVCLVVMGRHIPRLAFLSIVLSDEEPLTPAEDFYHRLHRTDEHDGIEFVDSYLKSNTPSELFDSVIIPAITTAETDHRLGLLEKDQLEFILAALEEIIEEMELRQQSMNPPMEEAAFRICCVPAKSRRDELAGGMLAQLLHRQGHAAENASSRMMSGEIVGWVREREANLVCVSVVSPSTVIQARYLTSKLRANFPHLRILVGMWGRSAKDSEAFRILKDSGADDIVTSVTQALEKVALTAPLTIVAAKEEEVPA